jgi:hypothetical protein
LAVFFVSAVRAFLFGVAAIWIWIRDGSVDLGNLGIPFLIVVAGVGVGMAFELKRHW